jgi:hypothetical protein
VSALAAAAIVAPGALASGIHGKATSQGYPSAVPHVTSLKPAKHAKRVVRSSSHSRARVAGAQTALHASRTTRTLPFTGTQLTLFVLVGAALIAGGVALKATARSRSRAE